MIFDYNFKKMKLIKNNFVVNFFLKAIALILIISIFFKSIIDVDQSYDTWSYHLPFAARIWRIAPAEVYSFESTFDHMFSGFPLLAEFLQGFFWLITNHLQAANLVSFLSLVLFLCFLKVYFAVPLYLSTIALLAIPLVQTHSTICYVDLPGNICISILILMTYLLYTKKSFSFKHHLSIVFIAAFGAANIKLQLIPLVFLILLFILVRIIWLHFRQIQGQKKPLKWLKPFIFSILLANILIFAVPIKNIAFHGNPFYPMKLEVAGIVLNHEFPLNNLAYPDYLKEASRPQRWIYSILEIKSPNWSHDQYSSDPSKNRMGGFFGAYVFFNILLLGYIALSDYCRETITAVILVVIMSVVAANYPQSHELRYFMYWMISLVSINLYLVSRYNKSAIASSSSIKKLKLLNPQTIGLACLIALAVVITKTEFMYVKPSFYTLSKHITNNVDYNILSQIQPGDKVCLVGKYPHTFLYTSKFHSQLNYSYLIKARGKDKCVAKEKFL